MAVHGQPTEVLVSASRLFLLSKFGITGLLSASVFGLVIVRDGGLLFYRIRKVGSIPEELLHGQGWMSAFFYH
jgi:hypothetical protein